jgi:Domain of unknown function (DUF4397)
MKYFLNSLMYAFAGLLLAACGQTTDPKPQANLRILHASPGAAGVDVLLDGGRILTGFTYKDATAFNQVEAGKRNIKVFATTTTTPALIDASPDLVEGKYYTVIAANSVAAIEPLVIEDDGVAPATGKLKLRVAHLAPKAGAVDIYLTAPTDDILSTSFAPTLANVAFKAVSPVQEIAPGDYRIRMTAAGSKAVIYDSSKLTLPAGANLLLAALEQNVGTSPVTLVSLSRNYQIPRTEIADTNALFRLVNLSPDAAPLDVLVDNPADTVPPAISGVAYPANSAYVPLPSGTHNFKLTAAGSRTGLVNGDSALGASSAYSVFAMNLLAKIEIVVAQDFLAPPTAGNAFIRFVHGSPDAGAVDVIRSDGGTLANPVTLHTSLAFKTVPFPTSVTAGTYNIKLNKTGTTTALTSADITLADGKIYTAVVTGSVDPAAASPLAIRLITDK